ncbi:MAG: efflux RND transporter permease subunit [Pseudomonadota bacterium]
MSDPSLPPHDEQKPGSRLVAWFADNVAAANILMIFLIVAGLGSISTMVREIFPSIDPRIINVTVVYPGATPQDVESGVTRRVEEAVIGIQGVQRVESNAQEGVGIVTIELEDFINGEEVLNDVETEISALQDFPPENAEDVTIVKVKAKSEVLSLVVKGDVAPIILRDWAEIVKDDILALPEVSLVEISGTPQREISIEIPENQLRRYDLTVGEVAERVRAFSIDFPAGTLQTGASEIIVRVQDRRYFGQEFQDVVIRSNVDGTLLRLGDIATIKDGFEDKDLLNQYNGQNAVFVDVSRSDSQDTLEIESAIRNYLETLELPDEITTTIWKNETIILKERINLLARNAILGYILVFIALLLFLDLKLAFWTSLGIPISFLGGLFLASLAGVSINMISLFALIVVLGIVVDDAIVSGESIFHEHETGKSKYPTLRGIQRVQAPVTIGVLTTIAAFSPLIFSTGVLGQILQPIPIIVISVLLLSLVEAFLILPAHLRHPKKWSMGLLAIIRSKVSKGLEWFIDKIIEPMAHLFFAGRYVFIVIVFLIIGFAISQVTSGNLKFIFFPQIESDEIRVNLELPVGTNFEKTKFHTDQIIDAFYELSDELSPPGQKLYENIATSIGVSFGDRGGPASTSSESISSHLSEITVELVGSDERTIAAREISQKWRQAIPEIPQVENLTFQSSLVTAGADINIEISHRDGNILENVSEILKQQIADMEGMSEVVDSLEPGKKEFVYELTDAGLAAGLTPFDIGQQLRDLFRGRSVDRIQRGSNEIEIFVRYPENLRESLSTLEQIRIRLPSGERAPINVIASIEERFSPTVIKRVDGRQVVSITGNVDESLLTPDEALSKIEKEFYEPLADQYPGLSYVLAGQNADQRSDLSTLGKNMLIALMIIFVMLTSLLRSYTKPFIIMLTIPLGIAGAIYGHMLLGFNLSFISLFGIVALTGVVINDSVVLVDYFNKLATERPDLDLYDRAMTALKRRFRPILLTTLTTSLGLFPMLLETSLQAQFIIPMAVSLACGIIFASTILIFFIPALLIIFGDFENLFHRKIKKIS